VTVAAVPAVGGAPATRPQQRAARPPADWDAPDEFAQTCVLLLLHERAMGRDELCERLRRLGLRDGDGAWMDAVLGAFEQLQIVRVADDADDGLAGYELTAAGARRLGEGADDLRATSVLLSRLLARCGERLVAGPGQRH
jgi:hypothetical protein